MSWKYFRDKSGWIILIFLLGIGLAFSASWYGDIMPKTNATYDLGNNTFMWDNIYAENYYGGTGSLTINSSDYWDNLNSPSDITIFIKEDGTTPLTANWDAGVYNITADWFIGNIKADRIGNSTDYISVNLTSNMIEFYIGGDKVAQLENGGNLKIRGEFYEGTNFG